MSSATIAVLSATFSSLVLCGIFSPLGNAMPETSGALPRSTLYNKGYIASPPNVSALAGLMLAARTYCSPVSS